MILFRAVVALLLNVVYVNFSLKVEMYDKITSKDMKPLLTRVVQNFFTIVVNYTSLQYFSLVTVSLFSNLAPLLTCVLGATFFNEKITKSQVITLIIAFCAILCLIFGAPPTQNDNESKAEWWAWVLLVLNPVAMSTG